MEKRLQLLWNEVMPDGGPCPQPDVTAVRRRVDAALDGRPRAMPHRILRLAVAAAAAMLLITGAAAASGALELPLHNVLSFFFRGENAPGSEQLVDAQPISVSDDNYTLTVPTSLADRNDVYFTLLIEAKTARARAYLSAPDLVMSGALVIDIPRSNGGTATHTSAYDPLTRTVRVEVDATVSQTGEIAVRLNDMEEGLWLRFQAQPVSDLTLRIDAEDRGVGPWLNPGQIEGPVTLKTVTLSPLSCHVEFTTAEYGLFPVLYFLWEDGTVDSLKNLSTPGGGHGDRQGDLYVIEHTWPFEAVQDLSRLSAVIFEGMAYPLDGSEPYEINVSAILIQKAEDGSAKFTSWMVNP